jgi:hypothetical protein
LVRDGVESSSAWHAKVSQSRTLAAGSSDVQARSTNLRFGPEGVENGDLASMGFRFAIEPADVYSAPTRTRKSISRDAKSAWSDFRLSSSRQSRYIDEGGECDVGRMGHWCDLRGVVDAARTIWTHKTGVLYSLSLSLPSFLSPSSHSLSGPPSLQSGQRQVHLPRASRFTIGCE